MPGIKSGFGEQIGQLGRDIAQGVLDAPKQIIKGFDGGKVNETTGQGTAGGKKGQSAGQTKGGSLRDAVIGRVRTPEEIAREDEIMKQKQLTEARRLLQQFIQPPQQEEPTVYEKKMREEEEKKQQEEMMKAQQAAKTIAPPKGKSGRGSAFAVKKRKAQGSEYKPNIKSG